MYLKSSQKLFAAGVIGLVLVCLFSSILLVHANPWTPMEWQNNGKLRTWNRDTNRNFIDDLIESLPSIERVDIVVAFNGCVTCCDDEEEIFTFLRTLGQVVYKGRFLTFACVSNVAVSDIPTIASRPEVAMVELTPEDRWFGIEERAMRVEPSPAYSSSVREAFPDLDGTGANIVIIDSGVDDDNAPLRGSLVAHAQCSSEDTNGDGRPDITTCDPAINPGDALTLAGMGEHGTAMAEIALGRDDGIAPGAGLIDISVVTLNEEGAPVPGYYEQLAALELVIEKKDDWQIDVVNLSLGSDEASDGLDVRSKLVDEVVARGIVVVAANASTQGNPGAGIGSPRSAAMAITVGDGETNGTDHRDNDTVGFSVHGPRENDEDLDRFDENKPEIITSSDFSTSPAAARTSGLAALILQERPGMNPGSVKDLLIRTAHMPDTDEPDIWDLSWDPEWGYGLTDAYEALYTSRHRTEEQTDLTFPNHPADPWFMSEDIWTASQMRGDPIQEGVLDTVFVRIVNNGDHVARNVRITVGVYVHSVGIPQFDEIGVIEIESISPEDGPIERSLDWIPPPIEGDVEHGCLRAFIDYGLDSDYENRSNYAQANIYVEQVGSPVEFKFQVENPLTEPAEITLEVQPVDTGWEWKYGISERSFYLDPFQCAKQVTFSVVPPLDAMPGERATFHVFGYAGQVLIGGITLQAFVPPEEPPLPDLIVAIAGAAEASPGQDISELVQLSVQNIGAAFAPGTFDDPMGHMVDVVLSSDDVLPVKFAAFSPHFHEDALLQGGRISGTETLQPSERISYSLPVGTVIPVDTPPGHYCLGAVVDPGTTVQESDEANNTACHWIKISPTQPEPEGMLSVSVSASATLTCGSEYSHELEVSWKVTGGTPPYDVTIKIIGPDGSEESVGVSELRGERSFRLTFPGGGRVKIEICVQDAEGSSASTSASASLSPCH